MKETIQPSEPWDLREQLLAYIQSLSDPVLTEDGGQVVSLVRTAHGAGTQAGGGEWRLEVEFGKLLFEYWGGGRSWVRRIERAERKGQRLRLWAHRPGWSTERVALDICEAAAAALANPEGQGAGGDESLHGGAGAEIDVGYISDPVQRRAEDRHSFECELVAMLARQFPDVQIERVTHRSDREHSFSVYYSRGWVRRGREAWAFLGLSDAEGTSAIENALAYGLIWLDWLRKRPADRRHAPTVGGLKLILPPPAVPIAAHRAAYLDPRAAAIEILEWTRGQEHPSQIDLSDYGNVETRLTPRLRGARLLEQLRPLLRDLVGECAGRLQVVPDASGEALSLRVFGLEVAHIEGRTIPRVYFGLEGDPTLLDGTNRAEFNTFVERVLKLRHRRSADRSHPFYRLQPERWLESLLVEDIGRIDPAFVPEHVYPQVPAFSGPASPEFSRGVIDILGVIRDRESGSHRLAVVELKLDEDPHLPLQGLDYWLRVKWLEDRGQFREYGYFPGLTPSPAPPVIYLVCPAFRFHSTTESILRYFHPSIRVIKVGVNQRWREGVKVLFRKTLQQGRRIEERVLGSSCDDGSFETHEGERPKS